MWKAAAFRDGEWQAIPVVALDGEPFSSEGLLGLVRNHSELSNSRLVSYLAQEVEHPLGHQRAIETWSAEAAQQSHEFDWVQPAKVAALDESIGLVARDGAPDAPPFTLAWHDRTAVIIQVTTTDERIRVEYVPGLRDEQRVERLRHRYAAPDHRTETVFEWRGYFGSESGVVDHWTTMRQNGRSFVASLKGTAGFVVGTVVRRLTRPQPAFERDPTQQQRLARMLEAYPYIDTACPDLATVIRGAEPCAVVFVHGTVSCGVQGLKDLWQSVPRPSRPIYRYEHDTFQPIEANARELAQLVTERLDAPRVLLAGHSRGGLVARMAAARLVGSLPAAVEVYTFGTPHMGTPLAAIGGRLMNVLFKLGEDFAGAIPLVSPLTKAYGYLYDAPGLPPGIDALREDSSVLDTMNTIGDRCSVRSWGSSFDFHKAPSGFGVGVEGALAGALADRTHDLVVPTASALSVGTPEPVLGCSHVHYFSQPPVRQAILNYCGSAVPSAPAAGSGAVGRGDGYIIVGGVRVARR